MFDHEPDVSSAPPWKRRRWVVITLVMASSLILAALQGFGGSPSADPDAKVELSREFAQRLDASRQTTTVLSEVYTVDQIYRSMMGPWGSQQVYVGDPELDELVWITGYRATMVDAEGDETLPQEFMCHSNLDLDISRHQHLHGSSSSFSPRLFTLSQGQLEIEFPPGFGIPVRSTEILDLTTQVLNLNHPDAALDVRHRVSLDWVPDREISSPELPGRGMKPLLPIAAYGLTLLEGDDGYFGVAEPDAEHQGPGCLVEEAVSEHTYGDGMGRSFTGHWRVPPGRQVNRTLVTHLMRVPFATTIHYIAVHLHPFAESLTLVDLTTGETLFESQASNFDDKIGLAKVDSMSSIAGVPVSPDHDYELVSVYQNTTDEMQDSMAVMYLYLRDLDFEMKMSDP